MKRRFAFILMFLTVLPVKAEEFDYYICGNWIAQQRLLWDSDNEHVQRVFDSVGTANEATELNRLTTTITDARTWIDRINRRLQAEHTRYADMMALAPYTRLFSPTDRSLDAWGRLNRRDQPIELGRSRTYGQVRLAFFERLREFAVHEGLVTEMPNGVSYGMPFSEFVLSDRRRFIDPSRDTQRLDPKNYSVNRRGQIVISTLQGFIQLLSLHFQVPIGWYDDAFQGYVSRHDFHQFMELFGAVHHEVAAFDRQTSDLRSVIRPAAESLVERLEQLQNDVILQQYVRRQTPTAASPFAPPLVYAATRSASALARRSLDIRSVHMLGSPTASSEHSYPNIPSVVGRTPTYVAASTPPAPVRSISQSPLSTSSAGGTPTAPSPTVASSNSLGASPTSPAFARRQSLPSIDEHSRAQAGTAVRPRPRATTATLPPVARRQSRPQGRPSSSNADPCIRCVQQNR